MAASKSDRRAMMITGWVMTIIGSGTVLFWVLYEAVMDFGNAPVATLVGVFVVLGLMCLLVPLPLLLATRRANARKSAIR
jgi:hypothetical protein